ncbi:MAG: hypothetical protein M1823_000566 [Watsoniomyces obsoletus]|nr:MAG: hypothetical protein M1823_000566 [Watsoniomyces obsoletus]
MNDEERRSAKRSRFDQTQRPDDGKRSSRFDRRSRSPVSKDPGSRRSRSPLNAQRISPTSSSLGDLKRPALDPAAAAAAAAAKINAQIQAKKGIQHVDVPPIMSRDGPSAKASSPPASGNLNGEVYVADGDYIKDIEVNDLRNRYTLTKGSTQKMIKEETGADVTTRGSYFPDKSMATAANPPLYLHVTSTTKEGLEKAVAKIEELMQQQLPNLVDERRFRRREPEQVERDELGRRKWPEERISVDLEPIPGFNLRAQVVGHGGAYVKHIQQETRCRVQIKGRGSGFIERDSGRESDEAMYLHIAGPDPREVQHAKELCEDLLANVKEQYERFKENPPPQSHGGYGHNSNYQSRHDRGSGGGGGYHTNNTNSYGGYGGGGPQSHSPAPPASAMSPTSHGAPGSDAGPPGATDYSAQYAQYYGGQDPYAAYGGYQNYVAYYQYYQQLQQQQQQQGGAAVGAGAGTSASPPPPPTEAPPPPPPSEPPSNGGGSFNAVPPPPGL